MLGATLALLIALDTNVVRDVTVAPGETLRTTSTGSGHPVVFVTGIFGGAFGFRKVIGPLSERGYRCIVIEPLGYGWSSHPSTADYSYAAQADRIGGVMDSLGVGSALVVAQSSGAAIAYRLTYRRPDLVKGMVSIDGGPAESAGTPGLRHALRFGGFLTKLFVGSGTLRSKVRHDLIENSGDTSWVTDSVVYEYTAGQAADVHGAIDALRKISKSREPESLRARLHESLVPVRLLFGTAPHPSGIRPEEVELLRTELRDFRIDSVQGSGQYVHEEQPDAVIAAVEQMSAPPPVVLDPPVSAVAAP
jgi:pimeloyl-ACP methyl ester carboxylesterase